MTQSALSKKLLVKPGHRVVLLNEPDGFPATLEPLPDGANLHFGASQSDANVVLLFAPDQDTLDAYAPRVVNEVKPDGALWIAYPKQSSKMKSDLTRDRGWESVTRQGWEGVSLVSIDETWSAMRFRPASAAKSKGR